MDLENLLKSPSTLFIFVQLFAFTVGANKLNDWFPKLVKRKNYSTVCSNRCWEPYRNLRPHNSSFDWFAPSFAANSWIVSSWATRYYAFLRSIVFGNRSKTSIHANKHLIGLRRRLMQIVARKVAQCLVACSTWRSKNGGLAIVHLRGPIFLLRK